MARRIVDEEMRFSIIVNGNEAQKELLDIEKANLQLTRSNKLARTEQRKLERQGKKNSARYKELSTEISKNTTTLQKNYTRMGQLENQLGVTGLSVTQLERKLSQLRIAWKNSTPGTKQIKLYEQQIKEVGAQLTKLRAKARGASSGISSIANGFNKYAALGASVIAGITGVVFKMQQLIDFNGKLSDAQADVRKTTQMTKKEVDDLAKSFGVLNTRTSRINLLKVAEEGGRIGIVKEEIGDFVKVMNKATVALSDSFPGGVEETARKLGKLKTLFPDSRDKSVEEGYNAIGSAINELGANGVATESNIANFATRLGSLPDVLKPSTAEALALGAGFEESGIQAEIAGRAYSIFLRQASEEGDKFAKVMGVSRKEIEDLINDDPLEFMIEFSKVLNGMNATEVSQTLDFLGVSADGANKIIGALSNNTDRFRQLIDLSNKSMAEGTSLTDEYNIKNNNLAATLEKVGKWLRGAFVAGPVTNGLTNLVNGVARLVGVIKDVNEEFEIETQRSFAAAKANRKLADESKNLLEEYEDLTKDGIVPTGEAKDKLDIITLRLKDHLGESVMMIDAETGSYKLNTAAVREQIKLKRLAADEEAATQASRLKGAQERREQLEEEKKLVERELELRNRQFQEENGQKLGQIRSAAGSAGPGSGQGGRFAESSLPGYKELNAARVRLSDINEGIEEQLKREVDLTEKLKELNFELADVDAFFKADDPAAAPEGPKDGDRKYIGGQLYIFRNGKWGVQFVPTTDPGGAQQSKDNLTKLYNEERDLENELIQDSFQKEMEQLAENHRQKLEALKKQLTTEGTLTAEQIEINGSIRRQIALQEDIFQSKQGALIEKGYQDDIKLLEESFKKEKTLREVRHQEEINALGSDNTAIKALKKAHRQEDLAAEEKHIKEVARTIKFITQNEQFEGFDLELLTPEQKEEILGRLEELEVALRRIAAAKSSISNQSEDEFSIGDATLDTDILGMTADQWFTMLENLDQTGNKFELVMGGLKAAMQLHQQYAAFVSANENRQLQEYEEAQSREQEALKNRLEAGFINQRQYDQAIEASDLELERRRADIAFRQARRERAIALASIAMNTAQAIISIWAQVPKGDFGISAGILTGFVVALGALQAATVLSTPLPARGFQDGLYPVRREQDGKVFNARYGGESRTGLVDFPTVFMAGEEGGSRPEMIINGTDYNNFSDSFKDSLHRELGRVKGYENGFYETSTEAPQYENNDDVATTAMTEALNRNTRILEKIDREGVIAILSRTMETSRQLDEDINEYKSLRERNQR